jgi:hypothetical protein
MTVVDQAIETQFIQKTGKSLASLCLARRPGSRSVGIPRRRQERPRPHGDANTLVTFHLRAGGGSTAPAASAGAAEDEIYAGPKAALRPIHDRVMAAVQGFGAFEIAPKKGYLSLRRKKQFAMVGPATKTQVEIGLNAKNLPASERLIPLPPGGMCPYKVRVASPEEVDATLIAWLRTAYDAAG